MTSEAPVRSVPLRALIVGASGVFGSRLAERVALEPDIALTLAGRRRDPLAAVATRIGGAAQVVTLDRGTLTVADLAVYDIVVDAAGPFQASATHMIETAIAAGVDYLDLADGRAWVGDIGRFDTAARAAGVAVTTGASSIPALSHAVIDDLVAGWRHIDSIAIGIFPGNRAPRGLAVVEAILSYVGKPVRVFRHRRWQDLPGWGQTHRVAVPGVGRRWASVCDTPEQDLLVARYRPTEAAEFFAGMELGVMHLGLAALAWPVRWGWIASLRPFAAPLLWIAQRLIAFGTDRGAMTVGVAGIERDGGSVARRWTLDASANRGPYVPTLAALAMLRHVRDGRGPPPGARACSGMLTLADFTEDFDRLGIACATNQPSARESADTMVKVSIETV